MYIQNLIHSFRATSNYRLNNAALKFVSERTITPYIERINFFYFIEEVTSLLYNISKYCI